MSRSRKKNPVVSDYSRSYTKWSKRQASKSVRRYKKTLTDGKSYRKVYPSYDIFDYRNRWFDDMDEYWCKHEFFKK